MKAYTVKKMKKIKKTSYATVETALRAAGFSNIESLYICNAQKPKTINYLKAIEMMNIKKEETLFIGDQIFTDILGANRSGIANILVKFIQAKDEVRIGKRRQIERVILKLYKRNKTFQNRIGNIIKEGDKLDVV